MMGIPLTIGALVIIALATSTRETRAESAVKLARYNPHMLTASALLWLLLLWPV